MQKISKDLIRSNLAAKKTALSADKLLTVRELKQAIQTLPVTINEQWYPCVAGHIQYFGFIKVMTWAVTASTKRFPEKYLMTILRLERYGK